MECRHFAGMFKKVTKFHYRLTSISVNLTHMRMTRVHLISFFVLFVVWPLNDHTAVSLQRSCLVVLPTHDILPLHFYIATAKINIEGSLSFTIHYGQDSSNTFLIPSGTSRVWNCCPNWTCHPPFWLTLAVTTAFRTQLIGLPLGFWPIAPTQTQYCFIQSVPAGEEAIWFWHHQVILPLQADALN